MSRAELVVLNKCLEENMSKGFISQSSSPFWAPLIFANKPDGGLRFCIDHCDITGITISNRYPLPSIWEIFYLLEGAKIYTKLDVRGAYNLLRVTEWDDDKLAFRTWYGLFKPTVMQFGTMNAAAVFQWYINNTIWEALDELASAYLDDLLIYSNSEEEHVEHVIWVMQSLLEAGLHLKPEKCEYHKEAVRYLGLIISTQGISMDEDKVERVRNWSWENRTKNTRLNNLFEVQQYLWFCNYYRRFLPKYSEKAPTLTRLTKKDEPFVWEAEQQLTFETMVTACTTAPVLRHFDHEWEVTIETDASDYVSAGGLSQYDDEGVLRSEAYVSEKHTPAECNYNIYDKELMAIIKALEEWRPESEGAASPLQLLTDYKNLEYFVAKYLLNRRRAQWLEFSTRFHSQIVYRPGKSNGKAGALTRRPGDLPDGGDERLEIMEQVVLMPQNLPEPLRLSEDGPSAQGRRLISDLLIEAYLTDLVPGRILTAIRTDSSLREISMAGCMEKERRVYYRGRLYVMEGGAVRRQIIQAHHDTVLAAHMGRAKTFNLLDPQYRWKEIH